MGLERHGKRGVVRGVVVEENTLRLVGCNSLLVARCIIVDVILLLAVAAVAAAVRVLINISSTQLHRLSIIICRSTVSKYHMLHQNNVQNVPRIASVKTLMQKKE
jgi:hypothetical protein